MSRNPMDRQSPPKNVVPGLIPVAHVLSRTGDAVLWIPVIRVFPHGVVCDLELVHADIPDQQRRRLILQDYTIQFTVDEDATHVTLGNPPGLTDEPFPVVFWKRGSSANGAVAAAWIGRLPGRRLSVACVSTGADGHRIVVDRSDIDSAMARAITIGEDDPRDDGLTFLG